MLEVNIDSNCPASIDLITLESISVEPYETNVESSVGNDQEDIRRFLKSSKSCMGFRFLGLNYHQFPGMLVCFLNL